MDIVEDLDDPHVPIAQACTALGVSRATLYRQTQPAKPPALPRSAPSPRRLSAPERQAVLDVLHSDEFVDQPPPEVYATLLSRGVYLASFRTMYRLLAASGESSERRAQRGPMKHAKPTLTATAPNQIWTWDITKLRGPLPGVFYCLYVVLDLFSRMTVGWLLAERESAELAEQLFAETVARHGVEPGSLTVHADRGSAMRSEGLAQLLGSLGVVRSFSRPHVSDDNAFSESQFKTLKYQPDYPDRFASPAHARAWCQEFFGWYNDLHQHSGLALFTPADVFYGRVEDIAARRQVALDTAYAAHPERVVKRSRIVARRSVARRSEVAGPRASRRVVHGSKEWVERGAERAEGRIGVPRAHVALRALVWPGMFLRLRGVSERLAAQDGALPVRRPPRRRWGSGLERRSARRAR
ncbi:transposase [Sorangium cellulosum So ce56]|uniref:Transposase n=1 Tax=Sorangium cellulosum (strain So ce56) TaxID=448385 RepID=A9GU32_SORC5|nr:IS3 family transposase [Sorangium cellulosum]CAN97029.1 transposase [Sorangium cellulosum So ce56]